METSRDAGSIPAASTRAGTTTRFKLKQARQHQLASLSFWLHVARGFGVSNNRDQLASWHLAASLLYFLRAVSLINGNFVAAFLLARVAFSFNLACLLWSSEFQIAKYISTQPASLVSPAALRPVAQSNTFRFLRHRAAPARRNPPQMPRTSSRASPMVSARNESWSK